MLYTQVFAAYHAAHGVPRLASYYIVQMTIACATVAHVSGLVTVIHAPVLGYRYNVGALDNRSCDFTNDHSLTTSANYCASKLVDVHIYFTRHWV